MDLFNYVTVIPNCISTELIKLYMSLANQETSPALVGVENQNKNFDVRITNWIPIPPEIGEKTNESIVNFYNNTLLSKYKQTIKFIEPTQFLYYNVGGKYDLHNDSEDFIQGKITRVVERDITILVYLNEDYEGGELELPDWGVSFKPKAGTLVAFPSYIEFSHKVLPIKSGKRYNLVSWICTNERIYPRPY